MPSMSQALLLTHTEVLRALCVVAARACHKVSCPCCKASPSRPPRRARALSRRPASSLSRGGSAFPERCVHLSEDGCVGADGDGRGCAGAV